MKDTFQNRRYIINGVFILIFLIYIGKLLYMQVIDTRYKSLAQNNFLKTQVLYPTRGLIFDRHDRLIVFNEPVYDLMVVPRDLEEFDTTFLCESLDIDQQQLEENLKKASKGLFYYKPSVLHKAMPLNRYQKLQEHLHNYPGMYAVTRTKRSYPYPNAALVLGDLGEVDSAQIYHDSYYKPRDYAGKSGLEFIYERVLRGHKGSQKVFVDKYDRVQGVYEAGTYDTIPISGQHITITLDIELQAYGELLMQNKIGSIVAIQPSTGEILALVSSPTFDPNLLSGRSRGDGFAMLNSDSLSPLFNRPIMGEYPPGSTFKPFVAAAALQDGSIASDFSYFCPGYYLIPGYYLRCSHDHEFPFNVAEGIRHSCNPYFWQTFRNNLDDNQYETMQESYQAWMDKMESFGFGIRTGIDLPSEHKGNLPPPDYYDGQYGRKGWRSTTIISLGIGQGELLTTPLQLANSYAAIANRGYYIPPHLTRQYQLDDSIYVVNPDRVYTAIDTQHFPPVIDGLEKVVQTGTARRSKIESISFCGKTGTAQNPHGEDHSIFAGFAPKENTEIAIAVIVENAGGGSRYAAPIASLIVEKYLNDTISSKRKKFETDIIEANLISESE